MISAIDVYCSFRKAQANYHNRPYKLPKDIEKFIEKMAISNTEAMIELSKRFNTRWMNVDMDRYFEYGFELFGKTFTYKKFLDRRLLIFYVDKDKNIKRQQKITKDALDNSLAFIASWTKAQKCRDDISLYKQYCMMKEDGITAPIKHFILNKIDKYAVVWLLSEKFLVLSDDERRLIPLIMEHYWQYASEIKKLEKYGN